MPSVICISTLDKPDPVAVPVIELRLLGLAPLAGVVIEALSDVLGNTVKVNPRTASGGMPLLAVMIIG